MNPTATQTYSFNNSWGGAKQRLHLLERFADPVTQALLKHTFKVSPPKRCLEVGAGGGSITRWLCENTPCNTKVIAVDINIELLQKLKYPNLSVVQQDVSQQLPEGLFDLIHTRAVLIHVKNRDQLLKQLVGKLRGNGCILIEEPDFSSFGPLDDTDDELKTVFCQVSKAIEVYQETTGGMVHDYGGTLESKLRKTGINILQMETTLRHVAGGSEEARFFALTYTQIKQKVLASAHLNEDLFDRFLKLFENPDFVFKTYSLVSVLGNKTNGIAGVK